MLKPLRRSNTDTVPSVQPNTTISITLVTLSLLLSVRLLIFDLAAMVVTDPTTFLNHRIDDFSVLRLERERGLWSVTGLVW